MARSATGALFLLLLLHLILAGAFRNNTVGRADEYKFPTTWAVLIAGSSGYDDYRHQADICHSYQLLKNGGLKDENIIVFMYDDIANHPKNPRPGVIINHPQGRDVYAGVPKDYVGNDVNANNVFAVLLGNTTALDGGSGKVLNSGPDDYIFVYFSGHGENEFLDMPTPQRIDAITLTIVLFKMHAQKSYKKMVFYLESCDAGSIFQGLLPPEINIYATTASNANEDSWGTYCPGYNPPPPPGYKTCLGDLYSVSWMEDSDTQNRWFETLNQQYQIVKTRTAVHGTYSRGSHVMQYGDMSFGSDRLGFYMGTNHPANDDATFINNNSLSFPKAAVNQQDASLLHFWHEYLEAPLDSSQKQDALKELVEVLSHVLHIDNSIELIGKLMFGSEQGSNIIKTVRPVGQPLVDNRSCLKSMVMIFEMHCGSLSKYRLKHIRSLANICNAGVSVEKMAEVSAQACSSIPCSR